MFGDATVVLLNDSTVLSVSGSLGEYELTVGLSLFISYYIQAWDGFAYNLNTFRITILNNRKALVFTNRKYKRKWRYAVVTSGDQNFIGKWQKAYSSGLFLQISSCKSLSTGLSIFLVINSKNSYITLGNWVKNANLKYLI